MTFQPTYGSDRRPSQLNAHFLQQQPRGSYPTYVEQPGAPYAYYNTNDTRRNSAYPPQAWAPQPPEQPRRQSHLGSSVAVFNQPMPSREYVRPPTYIAPAILACLCCCCIPGIVAIVKSCSADSAWGRGDIELAYKEGQKAKTWIIAAILLGLLFYILAAPFTSISFSF